MAGKRHRLAQRRKSIGFTQEKLAEKLGVDPTTVRRWENGEGDFFPIVVNGRLVLVSLDGETAATNWNAMSPSTRRLVLGYGFTAAAASVLGANDVAQRRHRTAPLTLSAPAHTSWAKATCNAVLNPMATTRRATAYLDDGVHDLPALRVVVDRAMQVSLSSDYGALEQSLPTLIRRAEAATMQHRQWASVDRQHAPTA